jgi:tRNA-dihydrouridine synthase A
VHQLKKEFPQLTISINGGIQTSAQVAEQLEHVDGVMLGREAYHNPWWLAGWDEAFCGEPPNDLTREGVEEQMVSYMEREAAANGTSWYSIARHMLGLRHGVPGARKWRQVWSDHRLKERSAREVWAIARQAGYAAEPAATLNE